MKVLCEFLTSTLQLVGTPFLALQKVPFSAYQTAQSTALKVSVKFGISVNIPCCSHLCRL